MHPAAGTFSGLSVSLSVSPTAYAVQSAVNCHRLAGLAAVEIPSPPGLAPPCLQTSKESRRPQAQRSPLAPSTQQIKASESQRVVSAQQLGQPLLPDLRSPCPFLPSPRCTLNHHRHHLPDLPNFQSLSSSSSILPTFPYLPFSHPPSFQVPLKLVTPYLPTQFQPTLPLHQLALYSTRNRRHRKASIPSSHSGSPPFDRPIFRQRDLSSDIAATASSPSPQTLSLFGSNKPQRLSKKHRYSHSTCLH